MGRSSLSRSGTRSGFVIALLVALLGLTGLLAFQAASSARSHRVVATKAIAEFARVATWEYAGAARRDVYENVTTPGLELVASAGGKKPDDIFERWDSIQTIAFDHDWIGAAHAEAYFSYLVESDSLEMRVRPGLEADEGLMRLAEALRADLPSRVAEAYDTRWNQAVLLDIAAWGPRAVVMRYYPEAQPGPVSLYGFVVPESVLAERLTEILEREAILPASTLGRAEQAEILSVEVRDGAGRKLVTSPGYSHGPFTDSEALGPAFGDFTVTVAMAPDAAETLVIGGLPGSRLPAILALLALTTGAVIAAIQLLRREAELGALRADFVSSISHELRTPIAQIRMFGETLLLDRVRSEEERQRSLEILVKESRRLAHQVDNVLLFSRAEQQGVRLDPRPMELNTLLDGVVDGFGPMAETRGMSLRTEFDPDVTATVDPMALEQAIINLLDNAVKYGPHGQTIRMGLRSTHTGHAQIVVEDEGPGIPKEDRDRVWDAYARLDRDRESAIAGTGIGLAVVREVVQRMGGRVRIEDGTSGGARFVIEFASQAEVPA